MSSEEQTVPAIADSCSADPDAQLSSTEYARKCRAFMDLLKDLKNLGGDLFFPLPRLIVIGSQSAGKSSLVEAVSTISVPRDGGTCTRCPIECNLSTSGDSWSCKIALRFSFSPTGDEQVPQTHDFGPPLTRKSDVEVWLRRAQAAILNPHLESSVFHNKTESELKVTNEQTLLFSKNTVVVDVTGPDLTDLSFVDLPGLIPNQEPTLIELVRELVVTHISGVNTLILITIPMSDDMENQQAVRLAREADESGERTIGILTKPDTISAGALSRRKMWKELLEGNSEIHALKHGYYCVRLPDDDERARNITRRESEQLANKLFSTTEPWNTVADRRRFGVPSFVKDISGLLVKLIESNLPKLRATVESLILACEDDLSLLPSLATDTPVTEGLLRVTSFCQAVFDATFGDKHKTLVQTSRKHYGRFKMKIFATRPNFWPSSREWEMNTLDSANTETPIDLAEVKCIISEAIGWELPGYIPFEATKNLILRFTSLWNAPTFSLFNAIFDHSCNFISELILEHFGQYRLLGNHVLGVTQILLENCKRATLEMLQKILAREHGPLLTQNVELFQSKERFWLDKYTNCWRNPSCYITQNIFLSPPPLDKKAHKTGSSFGCLKTGPVVVLRSNEVDDEAIPDEDLAALRVMATTRAYFDVAHMRVNDEIPLTIEHEFHQALATSLQKTLFDSLIEASDMPRKMAELLSEDPMVTERRSALLDKKKQLELIKCRLEQCRE